MFWDRIVPHSELAFARYVLVIVVAVCFSLSLLAVALYETRGPSAATIAQLKRETAELNQDHLALKKVVAALKTRDGESIYHLQQRVDFLDQVLASVCKQAGVACPPPFPAPSASPRPSVSPTAGSGAKPSPTVSPSAQARRTPHPRPTPHPRASPSPILCLGPICI